MSATGTASELARARSVAADAQAFLEAIDVAPDGTVVVAGVYGGIVMLGGAALPRTSQREAFPAFGGEAFLWRLPDGRGVPSGRCDDRQDCTSPNLCHPVEQRCVAPCVNDASCGIDERCTFDGLCLPLPGLKGCFLDTVSAAGATGEACTARCDRLNHGLACDNTSECCNLQMGVCEALSPTHTRGVSIGIDRQSQTANADPVPAPPNTMEPREGAALVPLPGSPTSVALLFGAGGSVSKVLQKRPPESWHLEVAKPEVPR